VIDGIVIVRSNSIPKEEVEETPSVDETNDEMSSTADVCDPENYKEVFRARRKLGRLTKALDEMVHSVLLVLDV